MNKFVFVAFFFVSCTTSQSKIYPEDRFLKLEDQGQFPVLEHVQPEAVSVFSRLTLSRLIAKHVVNLSTIYSPPEKVRVDIFSTGLPKLLFLVSRDEDKVQLVVPEERTVYLGEANSRPLEKIMGFPLSELFLLKMLLGQSKMPAEFDYIEHSNSSIYRVEFRDDTGFKYRLYFKQHICITENKSEQFKFSGMEVLNKESEYLFFAKLLFTDSSKNCRETYPLKVEFENFSNRFSGVIDNIQVKNGLVFKQTELANIFLPNFPGFNVELLNGKTFK